MNRVYTRVLAGIMVALLVYAAFAWLLFSGLNSVRLQQYQEQLAAPMVAWLRQAPEPHLNLLASLSYGENFFSLGQASDYAATSLQVDRLNHTQIVYRDLAESWAVLARLGEGMPLIELRFANPVEENVLWLARVMVQELEALSGDAREQRLSSWAAATSYNLEILPWASASALGQEQLSVIRHKGWVYQTGVNGVPHALWLSLRESELLKVSNLPLFNPWSLGVTLSLLVSGIVFLAGALFLLLEILDRRLRKLETMATRIARGELDTRVEESRFDLLERLSRVFNQMAAHIERLVGVQREMIHAVSHELRTPVARIRFGVQMIEDFEEPDMRTKQIRGIDHDIQELNELIDEILTYARLEQGGPVMDFQEVNLIDLVEQVVEEQQRINPERQVVCEFSKDSLQWAVSEAEPRYLHRALQNLVGNALRYAGAEVRVVCSFSDETCRIDVEDDGPGIPESDWEKVFTAFARLDDSRTRSSGGYGLGLSIVRRILYWHGGQAFVSRSADLGGARFSLVWPRQHLREAESH